MSRSKFGERLLEMMEEREWNMSMLEKKTGFSSSLISQWTRFDTAPKLSTLERLADFFNCRIDFLVGRSDREAVIKREAPISFPDRLSEVMEKQNLTKYRLAKEAKINQGLFKKWENGSDPLLFSVVKLADYFDCSIDYLAGRSDCM